MSSNTTTTTPTPTSTNVIQSSASEKLVPPPQSGKVNTGTDAGYARASFFAGASAGVVSTVASNPFETLRTRMSGDLKSTGAADKRMMTHMKLLFNKGFFNGMSVGLSANLIAAVPANSVYLPAYDFAKNWQISNFGYDPMYTPLTSAAFAVACTNLTLSPFFLVRTRAQLDTTGATTLQIAKSVFRESGIRGFYVGLLVNASGRIVEEGLFWFIYENLKLMTTGGAYDMREGQSILGSMASILGLSMVAKLTGVSIAFPYNSVMTHMRGINQATGKHDHTKIMPTVSYIYKKNGIRGFYSGLVPQTMRSLISKSTQVLVFEMVINKYCQYRGIERPKTSDKK